MQTFLNRDKYRRLYNSNDPILDTSSLSQCEKCKKQGSAFSRCSLCKAVEYCSKKCQTDDWKGAGLRKIAGENSHKKQCPWLKTSMEQWPQVEAIQKVFPWSAAIKGPVQMFWICNQIEILLGLAGDSAANGYWREPLDPCCLNFLHDSENSDRSSSKTYICHGSMLLQTVLPPHIDSWTLPIAQIPLLSFDDSASKSRIPALHDNNLVQDWASWYEWRKLERESPVALRMDMVLTVYHLLTKVLGVVDTSQDATKSRRSLNIHYLGAEKELNIIPLFSELALLIPNTDIVMTFFGPACQTLCDVAAKEYPGSVATRGTVFEYSAPEVLGGSKLRVKITARGDYDSPRGGTGDTEDKPDALIAENAGLFAYTTWQIVYNTAARKGTPWGVTEYHMAEAIEYEGHMWQWRDLTIQRCHLSAQRGLCSQETAQEDIARASRVQASGAGMNPFMRPGLMESTVAVPRAYNGFVLRVC